MGDGEKYNSFETWLYILDNLVVNNYHRDSTLIALGGGVVGDTVGFAAACYHRGVNFIQIPTSLLAQVDSSIGGKTGINHPAGKNLIGAFYQPKAVIIDMNTLQTLPKREFKAGLTEIIKAALICDADLFAFIETHLEAILQQENSAIQHCIKRACEIKSDIVSQDEKEHGARALLNLGHTFGHVFEQLFGYGNWLHGEAVAQGILMASELSIAMGLLDKESDKRIHTLIHNAAIIPALPKKIEHDAFLNTLYKDKKITNETLKFILLKHIGECCINTHVTPDQLRMLLDRKFV